MAVVINEGMIHERRIMPPNVRGHGAAGQELAHPPDFSTPLLRFTLVAMLRNVVAVVDAIAAGTEDVE